MDRKLQVPAIYKHFKNSHKNILPNNYIYATMGISKPLKEYEKILNTILNNTKVHLFSIQLTEKKKSITLFIKDNQYYHNAAECSEDLIIYKSLYDGGHMPYARSIDMFLSEVDKEKYPNVKQKYRFELVRY